MVILIQVIVVCTVILELQHNTFEYSNNKCIIGAKENEHTDLPGLPFSFVAKKIIQSILLVLIILN